MSKQKAPRTPSYRRGVPGRGHGKCSFVEAPREFTGVTTQVCGLWPFAVGAAAPSIGVPLGPHLTGESTVCMDPLFWFTRAKLINNPSQFVMAMPGLGKSTVVRRQILGQIAAGVCALILGDLKPDYADLVRAVGGQVITLGRGRDSLNVVDSGSALDDAARLVEHLGEHRDGLTREDAEELDRTAGRLRMEAHDRRVTAVAAQLSLIRQDRIHDYETTVLSSAMRVLVRDWTGAGAPVMRDLYTLIEAGPPEVREASGWRGQDHRYLEATERLQHTIRAWLESPLEESFGRQTTERLRLDVPALCIDISRISRSDVVQQSAALLACWSEGFGQINAANELADLGLAPQRLYSVVLDELWRPLAAGAPGIVDRINEVSRVNRTDGCAVTYCTHSLADLRAMRDEADRAKALGLVERAGAILCGGLPRRELTELAQVVGFTEAEQTMITGWATPPDWNPAAEPPGRGKFLIKVGQRPGVPFTLQLTAVEVSTDVHNTNRRWDAA